MKPRHEWGPADELANLLVNVWCWGGVGCLVAVALLYVLAVLDSHDMLPWATHANAARELTRADLECDWPSRTITIKRGAEITHPVWELCGWSLDGQGTFYIDGGGSTIIVPTVAGSCPADHEGDCSIK